MQMAMHWIFKLCVCVELIKLMGPLKCSPLMNTAGVVLSVVSAVMDSKPNIAGGLVLLWHASFCFKDGSFHVRSPRQKPLSFFYFLENWHTYRSHWEKQIGVFFTSLHEKVWELCPFEVRKNCSFFKIVSTVKREYLSSNDT